MSEKLFIAVDVFHAGAYWHTPDNPHQGYDRDDDGYYYAIVLQPLLVHNSQFKFGEDGVASPAVKTYFDWPADALAEPGRIQVMGGDLAEVLSREQRSAAPASITPVPFPAATELRMQWKDAVGTHNIARTLGAAPDAFKLPHMTWPTFAENNYISYRKPYWDHLDAAQQEEVFNWAYGLGISLHRIVQEAGTNPDVLCAGGGSIEGSPRTGHYFCTYFHPAPTEADGTITGDMERWRPFLRDPDAGRPPRLQRLYEELIVDQGISLNDKHLSPPRYNYTASDLKKYADALFDVTRDTYHELLWRSFQDMLHEAQDAAAEESLQHALARYYGFGERLRWPDGKIDSHQMMVVAARDEEDPPSGWQLTNAHSLAGQVFRIGPVPDEADITQYAVTDISIQGRSLFASNAAILNRLNERLRRVMEAARTHRRNGDPFEARVRRDPLHPDGLVWYLPKNARGEAESLTSPGGPAQGLPPGRPLISVPGALLDELAPEGRAESPPATAQPAGDEKLLRLHPPRRLLRPADLIENGNYDALKGYGRWIRFKVSLRRVSLTGLSAAHGVYQVNASGDAHPDDATIIKACLVNVPDDVSAALWFETRQANESPAYTVYPAGGPLSAKVVFVNDNGLFIYDDDGELAALVPKDVADRANAAAGMLVDFVCAARGGAPLQHAFNLLIATSGTPAQGPLFLLSEHFDHQVSRSAERLRERFEVELSPTPVEEAELDEPLLEHFANFNKLRLSLAPTDESGTQRPMALNHPDALIPLPPCEGDDDPSRCAIDMRPGAFSYWVSHQFSEEVQERTTRHEEHRYACFTSAGTPWLLTGQIEHQYTYRVPVAGTEPVVLRLSTDVRNLAALARPHTQLDAALVLLGWAPTLAEARTLIEDGKILVGGAPHTNPDYAVQLDDRIEPILDPNIRQCLRDSMEALSALPKWISPQDIAQLKEDLRATIATSPDPTTVLPALTFDHRKTDDGGRIELRLHRDYFRKALQETGWTAGAPPEAAQPAPLRPLYEALSDLVRGTALLHLERWNFDNTLSWPQSAVDAPASEHAFPSIAENVRFLEAGTFVLRFEDGDTDPRLQPIEDLLRPRFSDFQKALGDAIADPDDALWSPIALPVADFWQAPEDPDAPRLPLHETTNVIRLGLSVRRTPDQVVPKDVTRGRFIPLRPTDLPDLADVDLASDTLRLAARKDLERYVEPVPTSPLHASFAWIYTRDEDAAARDRERKNAIEGFPSGTHSTQWDPKRREKLFGEARPHLNFPTGAALGVPHVVTLYHIPHAFRPLQAHPGFGDPQTTQEFAYYLVSILHALANGQPLTSLLQIKIETGKAEAIQTLAQRQRARTLAGQVAEKLGALLDRVDALADADQNHALTCLSNLDHITHPPRTALQGLLAASPLLYVTSKGIAVGVFDPATFTEALYALRVTKHIRQPDPDPSNTSLLADDVDRFPFSHFFGEGQHRFVVDVLDDKNYDNEYEITENDYRSAPHTPDPTAPHFEPRPADTLKQRGTTRARAGEDVIEQIFSFDEDPSTTQRTIEADVVHYNNQWWRIANGKTNKLYLLPSRRFPRIPNPVKIHQSGGTPPEAPMQQPIWQSTIAVELVGGEITAQELESQFKTKLTDILGANGDVVIGLDSPRHVGEKVQGGAQKLAYKRIGLASVDHAEANGWYLTETYLSHYYFMVTPDEEPAQHDDQGFENDVFVITIELSPAPFSTTSTTKENRTWNPQTSLQRWFKYHRERQQTTNAERPADEPHVSEVLDELEKWFVHAPADPVHHGMPLLEPLEQDAPLESRSSPTVQMLRCTFSKDATGKWTLCQPPSGDELATGMVVATEIFALQVEEDGATKLRRDADHLIRVSVLDEPWRYTRARMRITRNVRNVGGSPASDINPRFVMTSGESDWNDYGRQPLVLYEDDLPAPVQYLYVDEAGGVDFATWVRAASDKAFSFGNVVERAINGTFAVTGSQPPHTTLPLWNQDAARSPERNVSALVYQVFRDLHPRQSRTGRADHIAQRDGQLARQILTPVPASSLGQLTHEDEHGEGRLRKGLVRTVSPWFRVIWTNADAEAGDAPVLEVNWRIKWKSRT